MRYELTDLRLFLEIAQARSLTAGAAAVFITPSAASYRLKNLEQAFGMPLFERTPRGMDLTPAGETVLAHVRELFEGIARMQGDVSRFVSGIKGHVRLVANSSSLNSFVTQTLGRFLVAYPGIDAHVEERQSETIPAAVLAREADIGIFAGDTDVEGVTLHPYAVDRLVIVTPRDHVLASQERIRLAATLPPSMASKSVRVCRPMDSRRCFPWWLQVWAWPWCQAACWPTGSRRSCWPRLSLMSPGLCASCIWWCARVRAFPVLSPSA